MPTVVSLFSGIGGLDLGLERAGFTVTTQVERDAFCQRVLDERWPGVERHGDVCEIGADGREWARDSAGRADAGHLRHCDLLTGGFPCQDLSVAGKRAGLSGSRSSLFYEFVRIAKALQPTWGLVENVPGLLSSHGGRDFWAVLTGLRECWPVVGYRILDSQHFGVPQRRRRVFLVGGPTEAGVTEVLALTEGGGGDSAAGGEAWPFLTGRAGKGPDLDGQDGALVMATLNSGGNAGGFRTEPGEHLVHALTAEGHDASEDGTGRGTPLVTFQNTGQGWWNESAVAQALRDGGSGSGPKEANLVAGSSIRRLTPLECERLQGFPDGWTCLCQPLTAYAADPDEAALALSVSRQPALSRTGERGDGERGGVDRATTRGRG